MLLVDCGCSYLCSTRAIKLLLFLSCKVMSRGLGRGPGRRTTVEGKGTHNMVTVSNDGAKHAVLRSTDKISNFWRANREISHPSSYLFLWMWHGNAK